MNVTANVLLNYIRCRRYAALNDPEDGGYPKDLQMVSPRQLAQYRQLFGELFLGQDQTLIQSETLSYDFHPLVELQETFDFVKDTGDMSQLFCLVPTTSKAFLKLRYRLDKHKYQLFVKNLDGVYEIKPLPEGAISPTYQQKRMKLMHRTDDLGRIVYRYMFRRFLYDAVYPNQKAKLYFVFLNGDYVHDGFAYQSALFHLFDFSDLYDDMKEVIEADIYRMINHLELSDFTACPLVKRECQKDSTFECKFVDFCFSHLPKENSILDYFNSHQGFEEMTDEGLVHHDTYDLIGEGYVDILDVPISWLRDEKHLMQYYCTETGHVHVHQKKIEAALKTLRFPLIYLDFEAVPSLLPRFFGEKPFTQSVFQYSIHIQEEEETLEKNGLGHYEFIAKPDTDGRRELVESMLHLIKDYDSSVIVYNKTFEVERLKEFQSVFPEYREALQDVIDRIVDLKDIVKNNKSLYLQLGFSEEDASRYNFYSRQMAGSYALKRVIEVFDPTAYKTLAIRRGDEAYTAYMQLGEMAPTDRDKTITDLLEYCKQDTYSMYQIIAGLKTYLSPGFTVR